MVEFSLKFEREKLEVDVTVLQLRKVNYKNMRKELARVDWKGNLAGKTVEQQQQGQGAEVSEVATIKRKVLGKLKELKVDKAPQSEVVHLRVMKEIADEIVEALVVIFQEAVESEWVPEDWKMANSVQIMHWTYQPSQNRAEIVWNQVILDPTELLKK
eukprot:g34283.t1